MDRELLEWAARAEGVELAWSSMDGQSPRRTDTWFSWNPLTDDGDALRLAVKLGMDLCIRQYATFANTIEQRTPGEPLAATRRAIVRAAAAIGQQEGE